ncbi:MAG: polysaccharide deacetylase family protein, partial [Treponema sp.]|nr:polysaccharide deacetylase family protein [Treponema sp.]
MFFSRNSPLAKFVCNGTRSFYREGHFRLKGKEKCVCLSFDDGPDPAVTPKILSILDKYRVKAIFFCKGSEAEKY